MNPPTTPPDVVQFRRENGRLLVRLPYEGVFRPTPVMPAAWSTNDKHQAAANGWKPNPDRITMALDARMADGPEVDAALGVPEPTVDEWEAGTRSLSREDIARLARLTNFPPAFFFGEDAPEVRNGFICGKGGCRRLGETDEPCPTCHGKGFVEPHG